jgi:hypothetical protein
MLSTVVPPWRAWLFNSSKSHLSPDEYVMAKMLRPEKIHGEYMTAQASYALFQCIDIRTGDYLHLLKICVRSKQIECKVS